MKTKKKLEQLMDQKVSKSQLKVIKGGIDAKAPSGTSVSRDICAPISE